MTRKERTYSKSKSNTPIPLTVIRAMNIMNIQSNKKAVNAIDDNGEENVDSTPTVWISGEQEKLGIMTGINLAAASLFGYSKSELINRKVNMLMPDVFANSHDSFLETYVNTGEGSLINSNKEILVFGKNKTQYIFPTYFSVKAVQSSLHGVQFLATFRIEKSFKASAYILTTLDGTIDAISSSCISLLKLDLSIFEQEKRNIQDHVQNIIRNRANIFLGPNNTGKSANPLKFVYPKDSDYLLDNSTYVHVNCHLRDLIFMGGKKHIGLQFRFEQAFDRGAVSQHQERVTRISNFQFRLDVTKFIFIGEYVEKSSAELQYVNTDFNDELLSSRSKFGGDSEMTGLEVITPGSNYSRAVQQQEEEEDAKIERFNYGLGIKILRLAGGKPQEVEDYKSEEDSQQDEEVDLSFSKTKPHQAMSRKKPKPHQEAIQIEKQEIELEDESMGDFSNIFKSRLALKAVLGDRRPGPAIKNLKRTVNVLFVVLLILAILDFILASQEFSFIQQKFELIDKSNRRNAEMMNALNRIQDLNLLNIGVLSSITTEATLRSDLKNSLDTTKDIKESLEAVSDSLSPDHLVLLNNPVITLTDINGLNVSKGLIQASDDVLSRSYAVYNKALNLITDDDPDYFYVTYNIMNNLYIGLSLSSELYVKELSGKIDDKNSTFLLLMIVSIAILLLALLILFPILYYINRSREEVLSLFLDIPEKTVKELFNKCEVFLTNLQIGEEDEVFSEVDGIELTKNIDHRNTNEFIPRKKRKHFKNSGTNQKIFFLKFFIIAVLVEAYFFYDYFSTIALLDNIGSLVIELNSTSISEPFYSFSNAAARHLFMSSTQPITNSDAQTVVTTSINMMYDLESGLITVRKFLNCDKILFKYNFIFKFIKLSKD